MLPLTDLLSALTALLSSLIDWLRPSISILLIFVIASDIASVLSLNTVSTLSIILFMPSKELLTSPMRDVASVSAVSAAVSQAMAEMRKEDIQ